MSDPEGKPKNGGANCNIGKTLIDWHQTVCEPPAAESSAGDGVAICYLDSKISPSVGHGSVDIVSLNEDLFLLNLRGTLRQDLNYQCEGEGWTRLHFRKSAKSSMDFKGVAAMELEGPLCQIVHQPLGVADDEKIEGGVELEWVTLMMRPNLLVERFKLDSVGLTDPVRRLAYGCDDFLLENWSLTPTMVRAMSQLAGSQYHGDLRKLHLEAKVTELICMMSGLMSDSGPLDLPLRLTRRDIDRLHEVRAFLLKTYRTPPSIDEISRRFGLNRNKLTYGFKHVFEVTISELCTECRLQEGWDLLRESDLPVSHIAERVGYGQASAFSSAFRKRFNLTPRQVRQNRC